MPSDNACQLRLLAHPEPARPLSANPGRFRAVGGGSGSVRNRRLMAGAECLTLTASAVGSP